MTAEGNLTVSGKESTFLHDVKVHGLATFQTTNTQELNTHDLTVTGSATFEGTISLSGPSQALISKPDTDSDGHDIIVQGQTSKFGAGGNVELQGGNGIVGGSAMLTGAASSMAKGAMIMVISFEIKFLTVAIYLLTFFTYFH